MQSSAARLPALAALPPASFAFVMATGIVAVAAHLQAQDAAAQLFGVVSAVGWLVLLGLNGARVALHGRQVLEDLADHARAPGFFTAVAATAVLGSECAIFELGVPWVQALGALAAALWLVLTYAVFTALTVRRHKPTLQRGINGTWLLAVVATQSMAVLAAVLAARMPQPARLQLNFVALSLWLLGGTVYVWLISLIFYRYTFLPFEPADLGPAYWINMGAMAISTLAGSLLVLAAPQAPLLQSMLPFLKGFSVLYWATGSWWIPLLVALAVWRYVLRRFPVRFDAGYWGAVFPLGMYSVATHELATALQLGFLLPLATVFFWLALAAWAVVFTGQALRLRA
jgi:tellurite resistance protein TehA-like permease